MGKALYRKYRSKSLMDVVGQDHITNTLKNALQKGAISHAYLFTGPRGTGKTSVARILAHEINELPYSDQIHLDIIEIDAASNRRIDEIRDLRDKVNIAPTSAKFKVYIIDEVHMLTREAFNALLKTLEEPPAHAVFILATTELHKVPDTIISRTQRYTFNPIALDKIVEHLGFIAKKEGLNVDGEALKALAVHGNGSFRDSISMLDQLSGMEREVYTLDDVRLLLGLPGAERITEVITAIEKSDTSGLFSSVEGLRSSGVDFNQAVRAISQVLREGIMLGTGTLPRKKTLALLSDLLPLTNGAHNYVALELAALNVMEEQPVAVIPPPAEAPDEEATQNEQDTQITPDSSTKEKWSALLDDVKGNHNTLYGVLRMAKASMTDDSVLMLTVTFGFHKKRLEADGHKKILRKYIEKHFAVSSYTVVVTPKETVADKKKPTKTSDQPDNIASVSNIFGGAELLD